MQFRYDLVADKLDLIRWQKQAKHYISKGMQRLTYHIYFKHYKIRANISTPSDSTAHLVELTLMETHRDKTFEIQAFLNIQPTLDTRFKENKDIVQYFEPGSVTGYFESNSAQHTVDQLSKIIKYVYKIENLKAFL